ncbi:hypothetical protein ACO1MI_13840, partial [Staphylococcus aureus]
HAATVPEAAPRRTLSHAPRHSLAILGPELQALHSVLVDVAEPAKLQSAVLGKLQLDSHKKGHLKRDRLRFFHAR